MTENGKLGILSDDELIRYIAHNKRRPTFTGPDNEILTLLRVLPSGDYILQDPNGNLKTYTANKGKPIITK